MTTKAEELSSLARAESAPSFAAPLRRAGLRTTEAIIGLNGREWKAIGTGVALAVLLLVVIDRTYAAAFLMVWLIGLCLLYARRSVESAVCVYAFAVPFEQIFFRYGVGRFNTMSYVAFGLLGLWLTMFGRTRFKRRPEVHELIFVAYLAWAALTSLWATDFTAWAAQLITLSGGFACFLVFSRGLIDLRAANRALWFLIVGALALGLYAQVYYQATPFIQRGAEDGFDSVVSTLGYGIDISGGEMARSTSVGAIAALVLAQARMIRRNKLVASAAAFLLSLFTILTVNRATTYGLLAAVGVWALLDNSLSKVIRNIFLVVVIGTVAVIGAMEINKDALEKRLVDTLAYENPNSVLTGRMDIWELGWDISQQQPFIGIGLGQFYDQLAQANAGFGRGAHSAYLETLAETGIIGLLLFLSLLFSLGFRALKTGDWRNGAVAWWTLLMLILTVHSLSRGKEFWVVLGISSAIARLVQSQVGRLSAGQNRIQPLLPAGRAPVSLTPEGIAQIQRSLKA